MLVAAQLGAAPGQVALPLAGLFCLTPTLSPEPVFPLPGGDRKNQSPRRDVSPPRHQQEMGGWGLWKNHEARSLTPNTNKNLAATGKGRVRPTLPHQYPVCRGWAWRASATRLRTEGQPWQPASERPQHKPVWSAGALPFPECCCAPPASPALRAEERLRPQCYPLQHVFSEKEGRGKMEGV